MMFKKIIIIDMTIIIMEEFLDPHVSNKLVLSKSIWKQVWLIADI